MCGGLEGNSPSDIVRVMLEGFVLIAWSATIGKCNSAT